MGEATFGDLAPMIVEAELALLAHLRLVLMVAVATVGTVVVWGIWCLCRATHPRG